MTLQPKRGLWWPKKESKLSFRGTKILLRLQFHPKLSFLGRTRRQFFETRNDPKRGFFPFLGTKKEDFPFLGTKKDDFLFWLPKKKISFFGCQKNKNLFFWSFLVSKNCLLVRPRKLSFGWNCSLNGILVPQKESLLSKGLFMLLDFF